MGMEDQNKSTKAKSQRLYLWRSWKVLHNTGWRVGGLVGDRNLSARSESFQRIKLYFTDSFIDFDTLFWHWQLLCFRDYFHLPPCSCMAAKYLILKWISKQHRHTFNNPLTCYPMPIFLLRELHIWSHRRNMTIDHFNSILPKMSPSAR